MRELLHHRNRRDIHGVARVGLEGADAALAQNHFVIAAGENVFRRQQQFFDGRGNAALQQNRLADLAEFAQQIEVLHVARADLQNVGIRSEQRNLRLVHHLADHQQTAPVRRLAHHFEAFFAESLKAVRRAARLECAAANDARAAVGDDVGGALDLIAALDAARSGHHDDPVAADLDIPDLDDGAAGPETPAGQLVGRDDAVNFLHALHHLDDRGVEIVPAADAAQHGVDHAGRAMNVESHFDQPVDHLLNLRFGRALLHDDEHCFLVLCRCHAVLLDLSHFVDNAFENALHRVRGERAARCATSRCRKPGPRACGS